MVTGLFGYQLSTPMDLTSFQLQFFITVADGKQGVASARPFDFLYPLTPARWIGVVERIGRLLERVPGVAEIAGSLLIRARKPTGRDGC